MSRRSLPVHAALALGTLLTTSCTYPTDAERYPREGERAFTLLSTDPADGAGGLPTNPVLRLRFSDFPDPQTAPAARIRSGAAELRCAADPKAPRPGETPCEVDLPRRELVLRPASLPPNQEHQIELGEELRSLAGAALPGMRVLRIRTADGTQAVTAPPPVRLGDVLGDGGGLVAGCGAVGGCHGASTDQAAARGLDLRLPAAALLVQLLRPALGSPDGLPLVDPKWPERSYLLRTLVAWDGFARVESGPMPPPPLVRLKDERIQLVNDWIRGGALP